MRRLTALLLSLVLLVALAPSPAAADHGEAVDGLYWSTDAADGSFQLLRVRERPGGDFTVRLFDTWATQACTTPSPVVAVDTTASFDASVGNLLVTFEPGELRCLRRRSSVALTGPVDVQLQLNPDGTLLERAGSPGTLWNPI
jgi:hypothetical protein